MHYKLNTISKWCENKAPWKNYASFSMHFQMFYALFSDFKYNLFLALDNKLNFSFAISGPHLIKTHVP